MNVLIGCEESGIVRDAFIARGHNAYSNDIEPTRREGPHLQMCVTRAIASRNDWDLIILHPECITVAVCGNKHYAGTLERETQIQWIVALWRQAKAKARIGVALENPRSVIWPHLRPIADQIQFIQPWQFGHTEQKTTGLALDRLPPLIRTKNVISEMYALPKHKRERVFYMQPGPDRSRLRAETYPGIADAMADQWGEII